MMRLIIVSNRLPVSVSKYEGEYHTQKSAGGLVSGLSDYLSALGKTDSDIDDYLWMGWPGMTIPKKDEKLIREKVKQEFNAAPVFFSQSLMDKVYLGFCNKTIWPLFHYFPTYARFDKDFWQQYQRLNHIFRDEILKVIEPDDIIWVHDYHLMLLPGMLREQVSNPIGFFLHIPFPSFEMYRLLPNESRNKILEGLLGADLIGFHTHDYSQYYLRCLRRLLGIENHMGRIALPLRTARVETFPMGIDYEKFHGLKTCVKIPGKPSGSEQKMILSVDRLDYSKGIVKRLQGFELFLEKNPQWHGKVYLNMIVVPSRTGVSSYQTIKRKLDELVGNINGKYGSIDWTPIIYQYTSLPHPQLIEQYRRSNVALLTPLRDGMNLVAKEYVASLVDKKGVLILSEFTGAAKELSESIIINPQSTDAIADAILEALNMPEEEQVKRNEIMQTRLKRYNVVHWADEYVKTLYDIWKLSTESFSKKRYTEQIATQLLEEYHQAKNRIIILNYDGTIVPYSQEPQAPKPDKGLVQLLRDVNKKQKTDIVILSGRSKEELDECLGKLNINLIAEHGSWIRDAETQKWDQLKPLSAEWKDDVMELLQIYTDRLHGSFIQEKEYSVSWYYHKADIEQAAFLAMEVYENLVDITSNIDVQVWHGNKVIEVANSGINKGELAMHWLSQKNYDFILAIGSGWSDELLFETVPERAYSFRVGKIQSEAKYLLESQEEVISLLKQLRK